MAAKKKSKTKSKAKPAKKARARVAKPKASKQRTSKPATRKRVATKAKAKKSKSRPSVQPQKEVEREFQGRTISNRTKGVARQEEDLKGASRAEQADSESVDELVEEGNLFEAGAVAGVEEADDSDEKEVHTHEFPEDDVPEEYLDED